MGRVRRVTSRDTVNLSTVSGKSPTTVAECFWSGRDIAQLIEDCEAGAPGLLLGLVTVVVVVTVLLYSR